MPRQVILYTAVSIDGFIARTDGNIDWLSSGLSNSATNEDHGYQLFYDRVDTTLIGRKTYEQILTFPCPFPYQDKINYVFSRQNPVTSNEFVQFINEDVQQFVRRLKEKTDGKDIWLVGGQLLNQTLLNEGLIDEIILSIIPIVLGKGIPLFGVNAIEQQFQLKGSQSFPSGCIQIIYHQQQKSATI